MNFREVSIIGSGPVGLFSIFQAGMLGMRCFIVDVLDFIGGQCAALYKEKPIYDIPAYQKIIAGELIKQLAKQAEPFNPEYCLGQQVLSYYKEDEYFVIETNKNTKLYSKVILIAAGNGIFSHNKPPIKNLSLYEGKSVFYSIDDKSYFKNKEVVIAGGGDTAADWALCLVSIVKKLYILHRRNQFRCKDHSLVQIKKLVNQGKIEIITPYQLDSINGSNGVIDSITVKNLKNETKTISADLLLLCFGLKMNLGSIGSWKLDFDYQKRIIVDPCYYQTNIPGIYAIGDIAAYEGKLKLILTGFAESASAIHHAYKYVFPGRALHFQHSTDKKIPNI